MEEEEEKGKEEKRVEKKTDGRGDKEGTRRGRGSEGGSRRRIVKDCTGFVWIAAATASTMALACNFCITAQQQAEAKTEARRQSQTDRQTA